MKIRRAAVAALSLALAPFALAVDPVNPLDVRGAAASVPVAEVAPRAALPDMLREGPVHFALPEGWARVESPATEKGFFRVAPKDLPAGTVFVVRISTGAPADGKTPAQRAADDTQSLAKGAFRHEHSEPKAFRTARGYEGVAIFHHRQHFAVPADFWQAVYLSAGGRGYVMAVQTGDKALLEKHAPALQQIMDSLVYAHAVEVAPAKAGVRALTLNDVYEVSDLFEWLFDVPFTAAQRTEIRDLLADVWAVDPAFGLTALAQADEVRKSLDEGTPEDREALRQVAGPQLAAKLRGAGGFLGKLAEIYDAGHKPLVAGDPPLTRQAADANLELIYFMASQVAGTPTTAPTKEQKDAWAAELAARFAKLPADERQNVARMPMIWAGTSADWPSVAPAERDARKAEWAKDATVKGVADALAKARAEAEKAAAEARAKNGGRDPLAYAKAYQAMANEQMKVQMISNMMSMQHQTNMMIIRNMGTQNYTYRYVYRYR